MLFHTTGENFLFKKKRSSTIRNFRKGDRRRLGNQEDARTFFWKTGGGTKLRKELRMRIYMGRGGFTS